MIKPCPSCNQNNWQHFLTKDGQIYAGCNTCSYATSLLALIDHSPSTREKMMLQAFTDVVWMAIRYAHGRHTSAPGTVRDAVKAVRFLFPDFKLQPDKVIKRIDLTETKNLPSDDLSDLFT